MHHFAITSRGGINSVLGTNPVTVFGNDCKLWINTASPENKNLSGPFQSRIASLLSDDNNHYLFDTIAGSEQRRNIGNKAFHILPGKFLRQTSASNFKLLHDGSSWTLTFRFMPIRPTSTTNDPLINNNNGSTANTGIYIAYDNRSSLSRSHALSVAITKGSAGQSISLLINDFFSATDFVTCRLMYNASTGDLTAHKDGVLAGTVNKGAFTHNTGNATHSFTLFRFSGTATYCEPALIKHPVIVNRTVSTPEGTTLDFIVEQGSEDFGTGKPANFYWGGGQSNYDGDSGQSRSPHNSLKNLMDKILMWTTTGRDNTQINAAQDFDFVKYRTNPNGTDPDFGPWLSFAYQMNQANPNNTFFSVYAVGGTSLQGSSSSWNVGSASTECAQQSTNQIVYSLDIMKYTYDRQPIMRGWQFREGESDGLNPVTTFKDDFYDLLIKHIDAIEAAGYSTSLMRVFIGYVHRTDYASPSRPYTADVDAAYDDAAADWATDNPSYASKVKGFNFVVSSDLPLGVDTTHFASTEMKTYGERFFTAAQPYMSEL